MLDSHGKLALVEVIVYVPVGLFCIYNNVRHGFRREAGWIYLTLFCIIKIAGSVMTILVEQGKDTGLATTAAILNTVALSPLLSATLSFLNTGLDDKHSFIYRISRLLKPLHVLIIIGLILGITGGINRTMTSQNSLNEGASELRIGSIVFAVVWILLVIACILYLGNIQHLEYIGRKLVMAVAFALPFILVRLIYSALNAINLDTSSSGSHTTKFNPVTGSWELYLALGLAPEVVIVCLYTLTGILNSCALNRKKQTEDNLEMNRLAVPHPYN